MFPLGTVLVPGGRLPLHVFEPRYRALMRDCLGRDRRFGVVLIERGSEVGGNDDRFGVGTLAEIQEEAELPDGRWVLLVSGEERIRVERWLPDDPYPRADVTPIPDQAWADDDGSLLAAAAGAVRRALALASELGYPGLDATFELPADHRAAVWELLARAPLGPADKQRLLEVEGHGERLTALAAATLEEAELLEYRLRA